MPEMKLYRAKAVELPSELARMVMTDDETGQETVVYERVARERRKAEEGIEFFNRPFVRHQTSLFLLRQGIDENMAPARKKATLPPPGDYSMSIR